MLNLNTTAGDYILVPPDDLDFRYVVGSGAPEFDSLFRLHEFSNLP